jgi:hypothetical protein
VAGSTSRAHNLKQPPLISSTHGRRPFLLPYDDDGPSPHDKKVTGGLKEGASRPAVAARNKSSAGKTDEQPIGEKKVSTIPPLPRQVYNPWHDYFRKLDNDKNAIRMLLRGRSHTSKTTLLEGRLIRRPLSVPPPPSVPPPSPPSSFE